MLIFSEEKKTYLHFMSFFNIEMTEVVEILPQVRQGSNYSTVNIMAADVLVI